MIEIIKTIILEIVYNKKWRWITVVILLTVSYRFFKFYYVNLYVHFIPAAKFNCINWDGSLNFRTSSISINVTPVLYSVKIPNRVVSFLTSSDAWDNYVNAATSVLQKYNSEHNTLDIQIVNKKISSILPFIYRKAIITEHNNDTVNINLKIANQLINSQK